MPQGDILFLIWVILPILGGGAVITLIIIIGQVLKARTSAISKRSFEILANELKEENAKIMVELTAVKENLLSINKMMKEIE